MESARRAAQATPVEGLVERLAAQFGAKASVDAVFGAPIVQEGRTVIPVARVRWGFGGGGGSSDGTPTGTASGSGGGGGVAADPTELEVYAGEEPPADYSMATEVGGIARVAKEAGFDRFHLVGYSGGGAASLAYAAANPERLASLAVMEPAFAGWQRMTAPER